METHDKLYRSQTDKVIGGVAGGLSDYFNLDVVLARVVFVLLALFGGGGILIYIVMWIIVPTNPSNYSSNYKDSSKQNSNSGPDENNNEAEIIYENKDKPQSNSGLIAGVVLILLGMLFLGDRLMPWYNIVDLWPLLLVLVGVLLIKPDIFKPSKKQNNEI